MDNRQIKPSESEVLINVMKLLNDQTAQIQENVQRLEDGFVTNAEIEGLSDEISSLSECIEAVAALALERLRHAGEEGRAHQGAGNELMRQASDIHANLMEIRRALWPENRVYN